MKKITLPKTSDGYQKKLDALVKSGISTPEDKYKYAYIMFNSIEFEMNRLKEVDQSNPIVQGLLQRYEPLKQKWSKILQYTEAECLASETLHQ